MKTVTNILLLIMAFGVLGCYQQADERIHLRDEVRNDSLGNNLVTRPVVRAFSALIGEGIKVEKAILKRSDAGLLELHVLGFNNSYSKRGFQYKVEWLDEDGLVVGSRTSVWHRTSAMGKSPFNFMVQATKPEAVNFRMDTRKWE
jgi:uncharacterized protein YcfL